MRLQVTAPPKRRRNARDVRTLASVADAHFDLVRHRERPIPSGPSEDAPPGGASGHRIRAARKLGIGLRDQAPGGVKADRASAASTVPHRHVTAIVGNAPRRHGAPTVRRASASSTGPRVRRVTGRIDSRPPRSDSAHREPRREFKPRPPGAGTRDGDRRERPSPARGADGPARERKFDRPKGPPRDRANDSRPPRSDSQNRGPRSEFKSRPPRAAGARRGPPAERSPRHRRQGRTAARSRRAGTIRPAAGERTAERRGRLAPAAAQAVIDADCWRPT